MHRTHSYWSAAASLLLVVSFSALLACQPPPGAREHCGDGTVNGSEECDGSPDCSDDCVLFDCGDGNIDGDENCDDGNDNNEDACRNNCTLPECVVDAHCSDPGEICLSTRCRPGCRTNADCDALPLPGEVCDINTCEPKPGADADCALDEVFDSTTGTCVKGCRTDDACQRVSRLSDRICTKKVGAIDTTEMPCTCASECTGNKICNGHCATVLSYSDIGVCQTGCREDSQCALGQTCNAYNRCVDQCATNADCCDTDAGNAGDTCVAGACIDGCTSNADCGRGTICSASLCVTGCETDNDCDGLHVCSDDSCVPPAEDLCGNGSKCVFVTAEGFSSSLGGATGADASCQVAALSSVSPSVQAGTFMAWISDSSTSPLDRFTQSAVPYKLLDGTTIANNWADLTDGTLASEIDIHEFGGARSSRAWTNTLSNGAANNLSMVPFFDSCSDWTDSMAETGLAGDAGTHTHSAWTDEGTLPCGSTYALYCFQQ